MGIRFVKPTAKQKSLILSVLAGIGVIATGVVSAKCAKKTSEEDTKLEKAKTYAPAAAVGAATIGCIALSTYISGEEITAVTAAAVAIGQKFSNYKKAVKENTTEEQLAEIDRAFYEKEIDRLEQELAEREHPTDEDDLATFVDRYSAYTFKAPKQEVEDGIVAANELWQQQDFLYWCDIFYLANNKDTLPYECTLGECGEYGGVGWSAEMLRQIDCKPAYFSVELRPFEGRPNTWIIDYPYEPEPCFMEY